MYALFTFFFFYISESRHADRYSQLTHSGAICSGTRS